MIKRPGSAECHSTELPEQQVPAEQADQLQLSGPSEPEVLQVPAELQERPEPAVLQEQPEPAERKPGLPEPEGPAE